MTRGISVRVRRPKRTRRLGQALDLQVVTPELTEIGREELEQLGPSAEDFSVIEPSGDVVGPDVTDVGAEFEEEPGFLETYKTPLIVGGVVAAAVAAFLVLRRK